MTKSAQDYQNDGFRGRVALRILKEGAFDMRYWSAAHNPCGTACCLGGNILLEAGYTQKMIDSEDRSYSGLAADVWAAHYGEDSAGNLDFYNAGVESVEWGVCPMSEITPQQAIDHLYSV